jgi:hypothetical protein
MGLAASTVVLIMVSLLEELDAACATWHAVIYLENASFPTAATKKQAHVNPSLRAQTCKAVCDLIFPTECHLALLRADIA